MKPSIGSRPNSRTVLSALGRPVVLEDGSVIDAIVRSREVLEYDGSTARTVTHVVLHVPDVTRGSIAQGQRVTVDGLGYYVAAAGASGDAWTRYVLSRTT